LRKGKGYEEDAPHHLGVPSFKARPITIDANSKVIIKFRLLSKPIESHIVDNVNLKLVTHTSHSFFLRVNLHQIVPSTIIGQHAPIRIGKNKKGPLIGPSGSSISIIVSLWLKK